MNKYKIAVYGSGNREHAIADKLSENENNIVYVYNGTNAMKYITNKLNINTNYNNNYDLLVSDCLYKNIDLVIIGSEEDINNGLSDLLRENGINVIAPSNDLSQIETSKIYGKNLMKKYDIPTANYINFNSFKDLIDFLDTYIEEKNNIKNNVLKLNGLAGGKGVFLPNNYEELISNINYIQDNNKLNNAAVNILYEQRLNGIEFSMHSFCDGKTTLFTPLSKDYKKIGEYENGPNTGGMGCVSNFNILDIINPQFHDSIINQLDNLKKKISNMVNDISYNGILYTGCIIDNIKENPIIKVLEFNCRFGDPETQSLIQHYNSSQLTIIFKKMVSCELDTIQNELNDNQMFLSVILTDDLYPISKSSEKIIINLNEIINITNNYFKDKSLFKIFTSLKQDNDLFYSFGGRIFTFTFKINNNNISSLYNKILEVNNFLSKINYDKIYYRHDIGMDIVIENNTIKNLYNNNDEKKIYNLAFLGTNNFTSLKTILYKYLDKLFIEKYSLFKNDNFFVDYDKNKIEKINTINIFTYNKNSSILELTKSYYNYIKYTYNINIDYIEYQQFLYNKLKVIVIDYDKEYHKKLLKYLYVLDIDFIFLVGYMKIVPESIIKCFNNKIFNFHPSLLPKYGKLMDLDVHKLVIENNEKNTGATLHIVTSKVDEGPILSQRNVDVNTHIDNVLKQNVQNIESKILQEFIMLLDYYDENLYNNNQINKICNTNILNYKSSGVDIDKGNKFVDIIKDLTKEQTIGGFSAAYELPDKSKILATTDGVGSKLELARKYNNYDNIGIDLVAMCVNDLLITGAKPLFFLDYYATHKLDLDKSKKILKSIIKGCEISNMKLIGGETAEMPHTYEKDKIDLAGFCVGILQPNMPELPLKSKIKPGDHLLYYKSDGIHSNGFSLINKISETRNIPKPIIDDMLKPTKIYYEELTKLFSTDYIKDYLYGIAHITGGGLIDNIPRILPPNTSFEIEEKIQPGYEFEFIYNNSNMSEEEMYQTYNLGIGLVLVVSQEFDLGEIFNDPQIGWFDINYLGKVIEGNKPVLPKLFDK